MNLEAITIEKCELSHVAKKGEAVLRVNFDGVTQQSAMEVIPQARQVVAHLALAIQEVIETQLAPHFIERRMPTEPLEGQISVLCHDESTIEYSSLEDKAHMRCSLSLFFETHLYEECDPCMPALDVLYAGREQMAQSMAARMVEEIAKGALKHAGFDVISELEFDFSE